jgi:hypothetical protein
MITILIRVPLHLENGLMRSTSPPNLLLSAFASLLLLGGCTGPGADGDGPEIPEGAFALDLAPFRGEAHAVAASWYDYDFDTHILTPTADKSFVVRDTSGDAPAYAAFKIVTYYNQDTGASGLFTLERTTWDGAAWTTPVPWVSERDIKTEGAACVDLFSGDEVDCEGDGWQLQLRIFPLFVPEVALVVGNPGVFVRSLAGVEGFDEVTVATVAEDNLSALPDPSTLGELDDGPASSPNATDWDRNLLAPNLPERGMVIGAGLQTPSSPAGDVYFLVTPQREMLKLTAAVGEGEVTVTYAISSLHAPSGLYVPFGDEQQATLTIPAAGEVTYVRLEEGALVQDPDEPLRRQLTPPFEQEWAFALEHLPVSDGDGLRWVLSSSSTAFNHTAAGGEAADALADIEAPTP